MSIQPVLRMGNPLLYKTSKPVNEFNTPFLQQLIQDLIETMQASGGVGIAAPQIGVLQQVMLIGFEQNDRYPHAKPIPLKTYINPSYEPLSEETVLGWESCLSVTPLRGIVPRYKQIKFIAYDEQGEQFTGVAEDFYARVFQHECDHLNGILFPQRIQDIRLLAYEDQVWEQVVNNQMLELD